MEIFSFKNVYTTVSGDYYQVSFDNDSENDGPYFLLQRQFEMPDGGECYMESHVEELIGHHQVRSAVLCEGILWLEYGDDKSVEVSFSVSRKEMTELQSALIDMLPDLVVRD